MRRCIQLALLGAGQVAPNPMVGAVLVYGDQVIGEGYHRQFGQPHAEVNCFQSVSTEHTCHISESTLYVSLEPCAHYGKTPPCTNLVIANKIKKVVIGSRDPFEEVNGKGIIALQQAGINVISGVLEKECNHLNRRFFTFHQKQRPYVILKWAQSNDGKIGGNEKRVQISRPQANLLVHKWRSEEAAIMVGTRTALLDNPSLTNRLWSGKHPLRIVLDRNLVLPASHQLLQDEFPTMVLNNNKSGGEGNKTFHCLESQDVVAETLRLLFRENIISLLVEGGARLLNSFIESGKWDEARVITNPDLYIEGGTVAPVLPIQTATLSQVGEDEIRFYKNETCL